MKDSAVVHLRIRYAKERFLEPSLPVNDVEHFERIREWRRCDRRCEELVRALAGDQEAASYAGVWHTLPVIDANPLSAAGADLVNGIWMKMAWLEQFSVRLEAREGLRELRS